MRGLQSKMPLMEPKPGAVDAPGDRCTNVNTTALLQAQDRPENKRIGFSIIRKDRRKNRRLTTPRNGNWLLPAT